MEYRKVTRDECMKALQLYRYTQEYNITSYMCYNDILDVLSCYLLEQCCNVDLLDKLYAAYEINSDIINNLEKEKYGNQI